MTKEDRIEAIKRIIDEGKLSLEKTKAIENPLFRAIAIVQIFYQMDSQTFAITSRHLLA